MSDQVRDVRRPGHFWADNEIVDDYLPGIGLHAFAVYMLLCKYADASGKCFPAVPTMAKQLGVSKPTIIKAINTLKDAQLISVEKQAYDNGKQKTNEYQLRPVEKHRGKPDLPLPKARVNVVDPSGGKPDLRLGVNVVDPNNTHIEQDPKKTLSPVANAPVESAPVADPPDVVAMRAVLQETMTQQERAEQEPQKEPPAEVKEVLPPPPALDPPPDGYVWIESSVSTLMGTAHLAPRDAKLPHALCKTHLKHIGMTHPTSAPCAACVALAAKRAARAAKRKPDEPPPSILHSSAELFEAVGAFCFDAHDAADRNAVGGRIGKIRKALADYAVAKMGHDPTPDDVAQIVARVKELPADYRKRNRDAALPQTAETFMTAYLKLMNGNGGSGNGTGIKYIWHGKEWEVHEGRVHVEIKPGIYRNIPASLAYWQSFLEEMDREEKHNAAVARK